MLFVGAAALVAWFSAAMTPGRPPAPPIVSRATPIDAKGALLADEIARLHDRLKPDVAPREAGRNPFVFRSATRTQRALAATSGAQRSADAQTNASTSAEATQVAAPPKLTLSGIAENPGADGASVRTAIISGDGQLFLAVEGDVVSVRRPAGSGGNIDHIEYRVGEISADSVELKDLGDGTIRRLALK